MDNTTLQKVRDLLDKNSQIGVVVGNSPTIDDMAGALSLYLALSHMGKKVAVASPTDPLVEVSSLVGVDRVKKDLAGDSGDLIVSFPYKEGEIEKVSYTIEEGLLNIVVKAGENGLTFSEQDVNFKRGGGAPSMLFVVGTPRLSDLGTLFNAEALKDTTVVNIDNKAENQGFGDVVLVSPKFSSVSEQIASLITSLGVDPDVDIAQNLFTGISTATDNFQKPTTSYLAFEMAGLLMRKGVNRIKEAQAQHTPVDSFFQPAAQAQHAPMPHGIQQPQPRQQQQPVRQAQGEQRHEQKPRNVGQQHGSMTQSHAQPSQQPPSHQPARQQQHDQGVKTPPDDWLTPKIYKGSTEL